MSSEWAVWKYALDLHLVTRLDLPRGAKFLHVAEQDGKLCLWTLVDTAENAAVETWDLWPATTGAKMVEKNAVKAIAIGTVLLLDGAYVVHVFATRAKA